MPAPSPPPRSRPRTRRGASARSDRGRATHATLCVLDAETMALVTAWLAYMPASIDDFWQQAPFPAAPGHFDLVLAALIQQTALTPSSAALIAAIKAIPVTGTAALKLLTVQDWRHFFLPANAALLPEFTRPGTPEERVDAFVRRVRKFFEVLSAPPVPAPGAVPGPPAIAIADNDPINAFMALAPGFGFPVGDWLDPAIEAALLGVFPDDPEARAWLLGVLHTLDDLVGATAGIGAAPLQFSLMEALYARGFTSRDAIRALSDEEFAHALTGTAAYPHAAAIMAAAGGSAALPEALAGGPFMPINPDGALVNCIPPWHLSPRGRCAICRNCWRPGSAPPARNRPRAANRWRRWSPAGAATSAACLPRRPTCTSPCR
ncbi:hypothetical protein [Massilia sp. Se16.2.3]|uniref:hypothetical protein n=1 Tax=Massilia sp. Se16.2.3 TaxID=2709303 RepID=UPI0016039125|nr:hypothetical protein [Massilia sp. Se16.2.3]QNB00109.1 hypothetical protein G4G31_16940 [Massilia sp. Se16.2.3]